MGVYARIARGAIGSSIGCGIGGQAAIGAMLDTESGYGRYIGVSVMPSSQVIYGIVIMFTLQRDPLTPQAAAGAFGVGLLSGLALLYSSIRQGQACASAINAAKAKPEVFGIALAPAAIIEGFSVFALVFALVVGATIPA